MRLSSGFRVVLVALTALAGEGFASAAYADCGSVHMRVFKAGWFIGGSGGDGVLVFRGRRYPLSIGGLSAGLVFGASETRLSGSVCRISSARDVEGVYGAAGAGAAVGIGAGVIALTNNRGALLRLSGRQVGLIANLDLSGMAVSLR